MELRHLREFRQRSPLVNLTLRESTTNAQIRDLLGGRIDVGFVLPPIDEPALRVFVDLALQAAGSRTPVRAKRSTA
ncbi:MAG: LysR substrate-binding domain-containing protein [Pseudomonadota bacterium]